MAYRQGHRQRPLPTALITSPAWKGGDPMPDPTQSGQDSLWVLWITVRWWTLVLDGEESPSVVLCLQLAAEAEFSTEHIYFALITPSEKPDEHGEVRSS